MNEETKPLLTLFGMAVRNLARRSIRTGFMVFFACVMAASLFVSSVLVTSMEQRLDTTIARMGADIIVAPKAADDIADSILLGERLGFYFDRSWIDRISSTPGVDRITPQLCLATLDAACCLQPTQIVAFDPESDFIVRPWLEEMKVPGLEKGQVIIGSKIVANVGDTIRFFNMPVRVAGVLAKTDTGFDNRVYMNFETAYELMRTPELRDVISGDVANERSVVSTLMIRLREGADGAFVAALLNGSLRDSPLHALTRNGLFGRISDSMKQLSAYGSFLTAALFLLVIPALACIFTITINERRYEFGVLAAVGATGPQLAAMILTEAAVIGAAGGILGVAVSGALLAIFQNAVVLKLGIPSLATSFAFLTATALKCAGVSLLVSLCASAYSVMEIGGQEPFRLIQGEE